MEKKNGLRKWLRNHAKSLDSLIKVAEDLDENGICVPDDVVEEILFNEDEKQTLNPIKDLTVGEFSEILTKKVWNILKEKGYVGEDNTLHVLVDNEEYELTETDSDEEKEMEYDNNGYFPVVENEECFKETKFEDEHALVFNDIKLYVTVDNHFLHGEMHDIRVWKMGSENKMYVSFTYVPDYYETNFITLLSEPYSVMVSFNNEKPRLNDLGKFSVACFHTTKEDDNVFYNITLAKDLK